MYPILSVIILLINKSDSGFAVNHSYGYRPNWTPLGPITIINNIHEKNDARLIG